MDSLTLKRHNSFQNENNRKATHSFAPRPLIVATRSLKIQLYLRELETNLLTEKIEVLSTSLFLNSTL